MWGEPLEVLVPLRYALSMDPSCNLPNVYQFRVVVQGISPLIWRRLLIRSDMSLATLHGALQIVFAWSDTHLLWSAKTASRLWTAFFPPARIGGDAHLYFRRMPW